MKIARELSRKPITITKKATISDVIRKLLENNISRIILVESAKPVGIITEKDVGLFLFSDSTKFGLDKILVDTLMKPIVFVDSETPVEKCCQIMTDKKISSLSLGDKDSVVGLFTKTDILSFFVENYSNKFKVVDFMTKEYVFSHSAAPLFKVVRKMFENKVSRIIIKNQKEEPIGVISFRDLFRISLELGSEEDDEGFTLSDKIRKGFLSEDGFGSISLAREVMAKELISIKFNNDLAQAAKLMLDKKVSGLGVLDGNGNLLGVISKTDITKAIASLR